jgi:chemotaxis protein methyltransferase CheR
MARQMAVAIPDSLLSKAAEYVAAKMGLYFPRERWGDLQRGIESAALDFGFSSVESCIRKLISSSWEKTQIEILASHLTVGETYFFREKNTFSALEEHIFPDLIRSRRRDQRRLRIWSAGCATGEEPYSIGILLHKLIPDLPDWNVTILATDINPSFLQKAARGVYSEWSFRDTPLWVKERHFKRHKEGRCEILPEIRQMVTFSYLNLAEDSYPSLLNNTTAMDMILCRNVLMYFAPERASKTIDKLHDALTDVGWLIVSPSEVSHGLFSQFETVTLREAILYKKAAVRDQRLGTSENAKVREQPAAKNRAREVESRAMTLPPIPERRPKETLADGQSKKLPPTPYVEALNLYGQGRYAEAAEILSQYLLDEENNAQAMALLARLYANQGKLTEALRWCEKALAENKLNPTLHFLRGMIFQEQGDIEAAVRSLKWSLYLDHNFTVAHFALGSLALRQGRLRESIKHFDNTLSLLSAYRAEEILPESDGLTAARLTEIIEVLRRSPNGRSPKTD